MGLSGLSIGHLLVVLVVVALVFGTKRLGSIGTDLGEAIKGFRKAMASDDEPQPQPGSREHTISLPADTGSAADLTRAPDAVSAAAHSEPPAGPRP